MHPFSTLLAIVVGGGQTLLRDAPEEVLSQSSVSHAASATVGIETPVLGCDPGLRQRRRERPMCLL